MSDKSDKRWTLRYGDLPAVTLAAPNEATARMLAMAHWSIKYGAPSINIFQIRAKEEPAMAAGRIGKALLAAGFKAPEGPEQYGDEDLLRSELAQIHADVIEPSGAEETGSFWDDWCYRAEGMQRIAETGEMHPTTAPGERSRVFDQLLDAYIDAVLVRFGLNPEEVARSTAYEPYADTPFRRKRSAFMALFGDPTTMQPSFRKPAVVVENDEELHRLFVEISKCLIGFEEARHTFEKK